MNAEATMVRGEAPTASAPETAPSQAYKRYVLLVLFLVAVLNHLDRNIVSILLEPIKQDLQVSDTAMGLLTGLAFAALYTTISIPVGLLADRYSRKKILASALALWSGMTVVCGYASSYLTLFLARMGVGAGEAGGIPSTTSLVGDYFKAEERASANAWIGLGSVCGLAAGLGIGGVINYYYGWRVAFVVAGAPGLLLALVIMLTLREPERGGSEAFRLKEPAPTVRETFRQLFANVALLHLIVGGALGGLVNGLLTWLPAYYSRAFGTHTAELGLWLTGLQAFGSILGVIVAGKLADRLYRRSPRWQPWLVLISEVACVPFLLALLLVESQMLSFALLVPAVALKFAYLGPYHATLIALAGTRNRATAAAFSMFAVNMIGHGLGPLLVGVLSDFFGGDSSHSLRMALCLLTPVLLWSSYHFYKAAQGLDASPPGPAR